LFEWGALISTTNYDTLITQQTGLEAITWRDREWLVQFHQGERKAVLHLHGDLAPFNESSRDARIAAAS
jgi:hypothetical protein